jgi:mRNA interferase MazF
MKHGEIRWYKFISPDKKRPVLILTRDSVIEYLGEVTIAPITTTIRNIPSEVFLSKSEGIPQECAVNADHLQTVSKGKIGALITSLTPAKMADVGRAIRFALDI